MTHSELAVRNGSVARRRAVLAAAAAVLLAAVSAAQDGQKLEIKTSDLEKAGRLINVPVHKSVLVDFNLPIKEARIAKSEIADVTATSPRQLVVTGRSFGVTQLVVWVSETEQHMIDVAVDIELDRLIASIRSAVPRAQVEAHAVLDSVVLTGLVPDTGSAERIMEIANIYSPKVLNQMQVAGTQQVLLRCTVAEVNRSAIRRMGFNGWIAGDNVRDVFFLSNLDGINPSNIGAPEGSVVTQRIPFLVGQDGIPVTASSTLSFGFPRVEMQVFVQALRENGLLRVLAEPNVVAISGQQADFLVGGEFPIPVPQGGNNNAITIEYREFGVRLRFTPTVNSEQSIRLRVQPEVSEPDLSNAVSFQGFVVPGLTQRRVDTVIELGSGQTFAIGGLLSERVRGVSRRVPALGDVPILGALFSSNEFQTDETELVVLVTPELVEPVSADQITYIPGARNSVPNDFEFYLMGQLDGASDSTRRTLLPRVNNQWPARPADLYGQDVGFKLRGPLGPAGFEEGT